MDDDTSPVDLFFHKWCTFPVLGEDERQFWAGVIEPLVLGLSDQQLITGITILLVAYIQLPASHGHISGYHFFIVNALAWFSINTHLVTLVVLRDRLSKRPDLRLWRTIAMILLALFLVISTFLTSHKYMFQPKDGNVDFDLFKCPAICFINDLPGHTGGQPMQWAVVGAFLLPWAYFNTLVPIFKPTKSRLKQKIITKYRAFTPSISLLCIIYHSLGWVLRNVWDLLRSAVLCAIFNVIWFTFGVVSMFSDRAHGRSLMAAGESENAWSFGQILPLLLVALPIVSAAEMFSGTLRLKDILILRCEPESTQA